MPFIEGNMSVKDWTNDLIANKDYKNDPLEKNHNNLLIHKQYQIY